jgi:hypothetical protein
MDEQRKFGPMTADHPSIGQTCPGCSQPIAAGDYTTLVVVGPGDDPEERERKRNGRFYNAVCVIAHWGCVTGED